MENDPNRLQAPPSSSTDHSLSQLARSIGEEIAKARKCQQSEGEALAQIESILTQALGHPAVDLSPVPPAWLEQATVAEREPPLDAGNDALA